MKYKIPLLIVMLLLFSVVVTAVGEAGKPYDFYDVPKCAGNISVRIYAMSQVNYTLVDCTKISVSDWNCPCAKSLYILTQKNTDSRFSALVQYYIEPLKSFTPSKDGKPTQEELYNDGLKRIYTIQDILITKNKELTGNDALSANSTINNILLGLLMFVGGVVFIAFLTIGLMWFYDDKLRKWLGLRDEDKMTLGMILKKVFTREDISRKELIRKDGSLTPNVKQVMPTPQKPKETKKSNAEEEIKKILEGLED